MAAYKGPMASFRPTKEEMNSPGNPALFEKIVGIPAQEWPEYMQNQKNWTKVDWKRHMQYVDAYGSYLMKCVKLRDIMLGGLKIQKGLEFGRQEIRDLKERYNF